MARVRLRRWRFPVWSCVLVIPLSMLMILAAGGGSSHAASQPPSTSGLVINYGNGFGGASSSALALNGGASINAAGQLILTNSNGDEARSAFSTTRVDLTKPFEVTYESVQPGSADGMTFAIQNDARGTAALGCFGGSLGIGIWSGEGDFCSSSAISPSVAVEYDLYSNSFESNVCGGPHIGFIANGNYEQYPAGYVCANPGNGFPLYSWVDYNGFALYLYLNDGPTKPSFPQLTYYLDLATAVGSSAYMGFTGSTGMYTANQDIYTWTVDSAPAPPVIAQPAAGSITNQSGFKISGTAEPNSTVNVYDSAPTSGTPSSPGSGPVPTATPNISPGGTASGGCAGAVVATATADGNGNWSAAVNGAADGIHSYIAQSFDSLGLLTSCSTTTSVTVDTTPPVSTVSFPSNNSNTNAAAWQSGCNTSVWNVTYSICGYVTDPNSYGSGVSAVTLVIQASSGTWVGKYWNGATCSWQTSPFWNLAVLAGGSGASGGFTSAGGGFTSSGGGFTSAGGGFTSAGGGFTSAGGLCNIASGGFTSAGGGFTSTGGGFTSAGGGFTSAGGGGVAVPWYFPTSMLAEGQYTITVQSEDVAGNIEANACSLTVCGPSTTVTVDTTPPTSSISFPASGTDFNALNWQNGCNTAPWNVTYSICGYATDPNTYGSGVAAVALLVQATSGPNNGLYWNGATCGWQSGQFWNLAVVQGGSGPSGGFTSAGGGFTSSGGGFSSSGGGFTSTGGGFTSAGGLCAASGGFTSSGGGFSSAGGGFTSAGGGFTSAGGGTVAVPWYLPTNLLGDATYAVTVQAEDASGNLEGDTCTGAGCSSSTRVDTTRPTASVLIGGQNQSGAVDIDPASTLHITFSEPMNQTSLQNMTLSPAPSSGTFAPHCTDGGYCENVDITGAALSAATIYTLTIPGGAAGCSPGCVSDLAGNGLDPGDGSTNPLTFTFTTGVGVPSVTTDSDADGIPDVWDGASLTVNSNVINTGAWGFSPSRKDLCLVEDWMTGPDGSTSYNQQISQAANQDIVNAFARQGIHLVIFEGANSAGLPSGYTGPLYGQSIPLQDALGFTNPNGSYDWTAFDAIRNSSFVPTGLAQFCHFAVIAHTLGGSLSTGTSRGFGASDFIVALGTEPDGVGNESQQAGTVMHELGHNLGLHHGGGDDVNYKPNYISVMNYSYQFTWPIKNGAPFLDYSESALGTLGQLDKGNLSETTGLGSAATGYSMKHKCGSTSVVVVDATGPIDWNCNGTIDTTTVSYNINNETDSSASPILYGFNDWGHITFGGGTIGFGATGDPPPPATSTIDTAADPSNTGVNSVQSVQVPQQNAVREQALITVPVKIYPSAQYTSTCPDYVNNGTNFVAAVIGTTYLSGSQIDPSTVRIAYGSNSEAPSATAVLDVTAPPPSGSTCTTLPPDRIPDFVGSYPISPLKLTKGSVVTLTITGKTKSGDLIKGSDSVAVK